MIYFIEHGREIEFSFEGIQYFLSCSNSQKKVSLWSNQYEQSFDSIEELIETATIHGGLRLINILPKIQLETIF